MTFLFGKNMQFTRLIKTEGRLREFNFRKAGFGDMEYFSVDVSDDKGNRILFRMQKEEGVWHIEQQLKPLPGWIMEIAHQLHDQIEEGLRVE